MCVCVATCVLGFLVAFLKLSEISFQIRTPHTTTLKTLPRIGGWGLCGGRGGRCVLALPCRRSLEGWLLDHPCGPCSKRRAVGHGNKRLLLASFTFTFGIDGLVSCLWNRCPLHVVQLVTQLISVTWMTCFFPA